MTKRKPKDKSHREKISRSVKKSWERRRAMHGETGRNDENPRVETLLRNRVPASKELTPAEIEKIVREIWTHPEKWVPVLWDFTPWEKQIEVMHAVRDHPRVAVRSGNSVGKTQIAALIAVLYMISHPPCTVVNTSANWRGIEEILFPYIRHLVRGCRIKLGPEPKATKWILDDRWRMVGVTAREPEAFAGYHNDHVLVIVDEASALSPDIAQAIEGLVPGSSDRVLYIGNPLRPGGPFYESFRSPEVWKTIHIDTEKSPNVRAKRTVIPGLATAEWVERRKKEWGLRSPAYQARVKGNFPDEGDDTLIPLSWVDDAKNFTPRRRTGAHPARYLGVDVARYGTDLSVFVLRAQHASGDSEVELLDFEQGMSVPLIAERVTELARKYLPIAVNVDDTGIGGGVVDILYGQNIRGVTAVSFSGAPSDPTLYLNLRAESYWKLRDQLDNTRGPKHPRLRIPHPHTERFYELATIRRTYSNRGQIQIEPKAEVKKRLGRSPDFSDALALSYAEPVERRLWGPEHFGAEDSFLSLPGDALKNVSGLWSEFLPHPSQAPNRVLGIYIPPRSADKAYVGYLFAFRTGDGTIYVEADFKQQPLRHLLTKAIRHAMALEVEHLVLDEAAYTQLVDSELEEACRRYNYRPRLLLLDNRSTHPHVRVRRIEPYLVTGRLKFVRDERRQTQALVEQLRRFPTTKYTQGPELLEMTIRGAVKIHNGQFASDGLGSRLHV